MRHDEFIARVRELGEYSSTDEAKHASHIVLRTLATRIPANEADDLAAQLPEPLDAPLREGRTDPPESFGVREFLRRVADEIGARPRTAEWDAAAVLTTVAESVSGGQLNQLITLLPADYAALLGKPELSH